MKHVMIALIVLGLCIGDTYGKNVFIIVNKFHGKRIIRVDCNSGNDQLEVVNLSNGQSKGWRFDDAFFDQTIFRCEIRDNYRKVYRKFDAYRTGWNRSLKNRANATWLATERGIYRIFNSGPTEFNFPWLPIPDVMLNNP